MLVLTRQIGQEIVIDGTITVTVMAIDGNKIRLGITAPKSIPVDRGEVHQRRNAELDPEVLAFCEVNAELLTVP